MVEFVAQSLHVRLDFAQETRLLCLAEEILFDYHVLFHFIEHVGVTCFEEADTVRRVAHQFVVALLRFIGFCGEFFT
jgi:hypothetical protein